MQSRQKHQNRIEKKPDAFTLKERVALLLAALTLGLILGQFYPAIATLGTAL